MTFDANPDYVAGKPKIDHIVIKFFAEPEAAYAALAAGQIDWIPNLQPADMKSITDLTKDASSFSVFGSYLEYLVFNLYTGKEGGPAAGFPALQDVNVRKAIRMGINRENLVKTALNGLVTVTDSPYDGTDYVNKAVKTTGYNLDAAKKMLDDAGWKVGSDGIREKDGKKFEVSYISTTAAQRKRNQAIIQQDLQALGIKANIDNKPASEFFAPFPQGGILSTGKYDLGEFANNTVITNPANASVRALMMCAELVTPENTGGQNNGGYCNEADKFDDLQLKTEQSLDAKERQAAADKIQEIYNRDVPFIILYNRPDIYAYRTSAFAAKPVIGTGILNMWFAVEKWELK